MEQTMVVCVTGAAGHIGLSLMHMLCQGQVFGLDKKIQLHLLELEEKVEYLEAVIMELQDCTYKLLKNAIAFSDPEQAFENADFIIFLGGYARSPGMQRSQLLKLNKGIFEHQGKILNKVAKKQCKCLVVANPANSNCSILSQNAPSIASQNFTCLARLDYNRAMSALSVKSGSSIQAIKGLIIWGNHSQTQYPDTSYVTIQQKKVQEVIDKEWLNGDFIKSVQMRGTQILMKKKMSSVISAAVAIKDHILDWRKGKQGHVSMGVLLKESCYGIRKKLCFSLPILCKGQYKTQIIQDFALNQQQKHKLKLCEQQLIQQQKVMFQPNQ